MVVTGPSANRALRVVPIGARLPGSVMVGAPVKSTVPPTSWEIFER